jgi:cytoskeletal protein RodZ
MPQRSKKHFKIPKQREKPNRFFLIFTVLIIRGNICVGVYLMIVEYIFAEIWMGITRKIEARQVLQEELW